MYIIKLFIYLATITENVRARLEIYYVFWRFPYYLVVKISWYFTNDILQKGLNSQTRLNTVTVIKKLKDENKYYTSKRKKVIAG